MQIFIADLFLLLKVYLILKNKNRDIFCLADCAHWLGKVAYIHNQYSRFVFLYNTYYKVSSLWIEIAGAPAL